MIEYQLRDLLRQVREAKQKWWREHHALNPTHIFFPENMQGCVVHWDASYSTQDPMVSILCGKVELMGLPVVFISDLPEIKVGVIG